ncbi:MAG: monovalent cation/H+ antiporter complex subunit F [Planctomycetota bacterium]
MNDAMIPPDGDPTHWLFLVAAAILGLGILASFFRLIKGPSLADRVVALDLIGYLVIGVMILLSVVTQRESFLFVPVVAAIILFLGTAAFAIYLERREHT